MSRQLKELRSLMPWTWDARIDEHPAGESSLRDFKDVYSWTGDGKGRRAGGNHRDALPTPPPRKCSRKSEQCSSGSDAAPERAPRSNQAPTAAPLQTPNTRDSGASSGEHLSLPAATPGTVLRSSGRSGKCRLAATPAAANMKTPAPPVQRSSSPPDSAISTGDCLPLRDGSIAPQRRRTVAADTPGLSEEALVTSAAEASPAGGLAVAAAAEMASPEPDCKPAPASMSVSAAVSQPAKAGSPPKPFEAKLAAVDAEDSASPPPPPSQQRRQDAPSMQQRDPQQPEPLEHEAEQEAAETEEIIAAAVLLELPAAHPLAVAAAQRRPMQALDPNSRRGGAVGNNQTNQKAQRPQRPRNGLLDAAWAATGIAKRPPQQKRSARRLNPAAARALSPRLLSQFPGCQRPAPPPAAALLPVEALPSPETQPQAAALTPPAAAAADASAAPTETDPAERQAAQTPAALSTVSAPPPALPELPPIAPLDLQRLPVRLAAEVPAAQLGGGSQRQAVTRLAVQQAAPSGTVQPHTSCQIYAGASSWSAAGPFTLPSPSAPLKRPGDPLDLAHACKLLKWMDALEDARRSCR